MSRLRRTVTTALVAPMLAVAVAGCGTDAASTEAASESPAPDAENRLAPIACATDDPDDVGPLSGAWRGNDDGVYYIRQVGDCIWWFGTEVDALEPAGQRGFANVAAGRVDGTQIDVEWVDIPLGDVMGGGGLSFVYHEGVDELVLTQQRGGWIPFGGTVLTRIDPDATPDATPSPSASPEGS